VQSIPILGPMSRIIWAFYKVFKFRFRFRANLLVPGIRSLDESLVKYADSLEKKYSTPKQLTKIEWPPSAE
jgi:hypothetical protein